MQGQLAVSTASGRAWTRSSVGGWCRLDLKRAVAGSVSQVQSGSSEKGWVGMVETKFHFSLESGRLPSLLQGLQ